LNGIDSNGLSTKSNQVFVRNFPGAMTQDMIDFAKPIINKKPDAIVLHVGTNDITNNIADTKSNISTIPLKTSKVSPLIPMFSFQI